MFAFAGGAFHEPAWVSDRDYRVLIEVPARDIGARAQDEGPAEVELRIEELLRDHGVKGAADLSTLQVMRFDPATGAALTYKNNLFQETPYDRPLQWHDASIPDPFPDRDRSVKSPWIARKNWGYYYEVNGEWKSGKLAWTHTQAGRASSWYAVYFNLLKDGKQRAPAPRGWIGDGSHRTAKMGKRSTGLYIPDIQLVDFNGDGLLDLLTGSSRGSVLWYENLGTRTEPRYTFARMLFQTDGRPIDPGFLTTPALVDWDGDGKQDLLLGAAKGWVYFYRNVDGRYEDMGPLQLNGHDLRSPASPVPEVAGPNGESIYKEDYEPLIEVVDWDGDGHPDLLLGGYVTGRVFWYRNTGRRDAKGMPVLEDRGPLMADGKPIDVGWTASPSVGDLDGDGDLDLIVGNWKKWGNESPPEIVEDFLAYYENTGTRQHPVLTMKPLPRIGKFPADDIATPSLGDWDGDGDLDLAVSDQGGLVWLFRNVGTPRAPKFDTRATPLTMPWGNDPLPAGGDAATPKLTDFFGRGRFDILTGYYLTESISAALPWSFRAPRPMLPTSQAIDHRSWRGDDWQYTEFADFDQDGKRDILFGDYWGHVWLHRNTSSDETAFDTTGVVITREDGKPVQVGSTEAKAYDFDTMQGPRTGVVSGDFDGDGTVDLIVSDVYGHYYFCPRGHHGREPKVAAQLLFGEIKRYASPYVVDWDGDGRLDLVVSQSDTHMLFRNVGAGKGVNGTPFAPLEKLSLPVVPVIGSVTRVALVDADHDGDRDLILSSDHGYDCYFEDSYLRHGYAEGRVVKFEHRPTR